MFDDTPLQYSGFCADYPRIYALLMSLWVDKYRPVDFSSLSYQPATTATLKDLAANTDLPHLLVYGPSGAGKMTRIRLLLQDIFDTSISKIKYEEKIFLTPSGKKIDIVLFSSNFHVEITPSDVGIYDRVVVQEIIKELAQTQQIDKSKRPFKAVVINDAERLTKDAQHALRRTMEKYSSNIRFILCCSSVGRVIAPIKSRCLLLPIATPSDAEIASILHRIGQAEGFKCTDDQVSSILKLANGNLRKAILALESSSINPASLQKDWSITLRNMASLIVKEQNPANLMAIRGNFYDLLNHCIPANMILKTLALHLLDMTDPSMSHELCRIFGEYDYRLNKGSKAIFHLEAMVAKVMCCVAKFKA